MSPTLHHARVATPHGELHVVEAGPPDGPAFVLLHGWPQTWREWQDLMLVAAGAGARMVAVDLPGIGESDAMDDAGRKSEIGTIVHEMIDTMALCDVTVVGHDAGGMVAYAMLRRYLDLARVVIVDTVIPGIAPWESVLANPYIWHFAFHSILGLPETVVTGREHAWFDYFFDTLASRPAAITHDARRAYVAGYSTPSRLTAGFDHYRAFPQDAEDNEKSAAGDHVETPLLYVRGEGRRVDIDAYADGFRTAGVATLATAVVPAVGHFVPEEAPVELWRLIDRGAAAD